jgi:Ran GTPase-activating protein (RanGAP) involved in mRNA processing and transport
MATNNYESLKLEEQISQCEPHWYVKLEKQNLTDQDLNIIVREAIINKECTGLWLGWNNISSVGVSIIANALYENTTLQYLYLSNNNISDEGVQSLANTLKLNNSTLKDLDLGNNDITDESVQYLAEMLKLNKNLNQLNLSSNRIGDQGVKLLADALTPTHNQSLEKLYLNSNRLITDASVSYLAEMLDSKRRLNTLWVQNCNLSEESRMTLRDTERSKKGNYLYV